MKILHYFIIAAIGIVAVVSSFDMVFAQNVRGYGFCCAHASSESGFSNGSEDRSPNISNMSLVLYDKFDQVSHNSTKNLYLEFFDEKNKTLVKNVSFFVNATKGDTILIHELFYTHTGSMTLKFSPGSDTGKLIINGTVEPTLGGMMSNNDILHIEMSAFTPGTYHFHIEALALVDINNIVDQSNPPTFDSWWSVDDKGNISKDTNSTTVSKIKNASPIQQFKSGVAADDVKCGLGLQLVIKTKDGSPACARPQTAQKLVERKWGWAMQPIGSIKPLPNRIMGLEDNTGIVTFGNQNYYFLTPNYTDTAYSNPVQVSFHDVVFTLFPPGFRGGLPTGDCESYDTVGKIVTGGGRYYWADAKFSDGTHELVHMFADSNPCPIYPKQTMFSNHTNPQAGLTFYDGRMKLLVSTDNQISTSINYTESKVTDDAIYLSQTVDEWKSKTPEQLRAYYEKYKDAFYDQLGSFLIKDEMKKELAKQKIQNIHDDFQVFPGMSLDSLPPHISYDAVVNATDGNSYLLLGGVFANQIESSPKIIKLVFDKNALHSLSTGNGPSYPDPSTNAPVDNSTSQEKVQIAGTYIEDSDIPWSSVGTGNYGVIQIGLYTSVYHMIPDAQKYYTARALQLIPFYVPVKILPPPPTEK